MTEPRAPETPRHTAELEALLRARARARGRRRAVALTGVPLLALGAFGAGAWALTRPSDPDVSIVAGGPERPVFRVDPADLPKDLPATLGTMLTEGMDEPIDLQRLRRLTTFVDGSERYELWIAPNAARPGNQLLVGGQNSNFALATLIRSRPCIPATPPVGICSLIGGNGADPVIGWATTPRVRALFERGPDVVVSPEEGYFLVGGGRRTLTAVIGENERGDELDVAPQLTGRSGARCAATRTKPGTGGRVAGGRVLSVGPFSGAIASIGIGRFASVTPVPLPITIAANGPQLVRVSITRIDEIPGIAVFAADGRRVRTLVLPRGESTAVIEGAVFPGAGCYRVTARWPGGSESVVIRATATPVEGLTPPDLRGPAPRRVPTDGTPRWAFAPAQLPPGLPAPLRNYLADTGALHRIDLRTLRRVIRTRTGASELWHARPLPGTQRGPILLAVSASRPDLLGGSVSESSRGTGSPPPPHQRCETPPDFLVTLCGEGFGRAGRDVARVEAILEDGSRRLGYLAGRFFTLEGDGNARSLPVAVSVRDGVGVEIGRIPLSPSPQGALGPDLDGLVRVPNLALSSAEEAGEILRGRGLVGNALEGAPPRPSMRGAAEVTGQIPAAGAAVRPGAIVVLTVMGATARRFAATPALLRRAATAEDVAPREIAFDPSIDPATYRLARTATRTTRRYYIAERRTGELCLAVVAPEGYPPYCEPRGRLAGKGVIWYPPDFVPDPGQGRRLVEAIVADGLDRAVADDGSRGRVVDNVIVMLVGPKARRVTISGPAGSARSDVPRVGQRLP